MSNNIPEAKLLRKKLKNGLIVDKWDLVNLIEQQQDKLTKYELRHAEQRKRIDELEKQLAFMEGEYPEPTIMAKMMEVDLVRQQADRIGVLEANHKIQVNINEAALQYIEQLEQGLRASINLNKAQNERK